MATKTKKHWTSEEDNILIEKGSFFTDVVLSFMLPGRSPATIRVRRHRLGLAKELSAEQQIAVDDATPKGVIPDRELAKTLANQVGADVMLVWRHMWKICEFKG